jgi:pilus assembly protein CpaF
MSTLGSPARDDRYESRASLCNAVLQHLNLDRLATLSPEAAHNDALGTAREVIDAFAASLSDAERDQLSREIVGEVLAMGPLQPLLKDYTISDILVNGCHEVYAERRGRLHKTDVRFADDGHLLQTIAAIATRVGRRIDQSSPILDAQLFDGSRVHAMIPPVAVDGPCISIRRFGRVPISADELVQRNSLSSAMLKLLQTMVRGRLNVMISGGGGSGKTTLLNALSASIPDSERIITIEDTAELQLKQPHVLRLEVRPADIEGKGAVRERQLVISSLRMRPDRIIVGEVRGEEAFDMLQAMNTGHDGSLTTLHANSPRDALSRIESMVAMTGTNIPSHYIRQHIASAVHAVVQLSRFSDGVRKVVSISEVTGMEGEVISMQEIFKFERTGASTQGPVMGEFRWMGIRPRLLEKLGATSFDSRTGNQLE